MKEWAISDLKCEGVKSMELDVNVVDENIRLSSVIKEIIELVKSHNEELALDCEKILDKWSCT